MSETKKKKIDIELLKVLTTEFRVSHPHVFKPTRMKVEGKETGEPKYSIEMLFDKKSTDLKPLRTTLAWAATEKWGNKTEWPENIKSPIRDGDKPYGKKKEVKDEHKGMWVIRADALAEYGRPHVVGRDSDVSLENEADFYPGCYARASLKAHAYTFADKDGLKFILDGVQFIRHGKALSGKKAANEMFGVLEGSDDQDEAADEAEQAFGNSGDADEMSF